MRLILTTIILTMLAQPVWASNSDWRDCQHVRSEIYRLMDAFQANETKAREKNILSNRAFVELNGRIKKDAAEWAAIYNAICKD